MAKRSVWHGEAASSGRHHGESEINRKSTPGIGAASSAAAWREASAAAAWQQQYRSGISSMWRSENGSVLHQRNVAMAAASYGVKAPLAAGAVAQLMAISAASSNITHGNSIKRRNINQLRNAVASRLQQQQHIKRNSARQLWRQCRQAYINISRVIVSTK